MKTYNREEAQEYIRTMTTGHHKDATDNHYVDIKKAMDDIYDDVDSRTCENCIHPYDNKKDYSKYGNGEILDQTKMKNHWSYCEKLRINISKDFGCKPEFKRKENK